MAHAIQQVLDKMEQVLVAQDVGTADEVTVDRTVTVKRGQSKVIEVRESPEGESIAPGSVSKLQNRTLSVDIQLALRGASAADARGLAVDIEAALLASVELRALCKLGVNLVRNVDASSTSAEEVIASRILTFEVSYITTRGNPDVIS